MLVHFEDMNIVTVAALRLKMEGLAGFEGPLNLLLQQAIPHRDTPFFSAQVFETNTKRIRFCEMNHNLTVDSYITMILLFFQHPFVQHRRLFIRSKQCSG